MIATSQLNELHYSTRATWPHISILLVFQGLGHFLPSSAQQFDTSVGLDFFQNPLRPFPWVA